MLLSQCKAYGREMWIWDRTSVPGWMNLERCRFELCVEGLTTILSNSSFSFFCSSQCICNSKQLRVRKISLSHITESYNSDKLLEHWRISHCHSTFLAASEVTSYKLCLLWNCVQDAKLFFDINKVQKAGLTLISICWSSSHSAGLWVLSVLAFCKRNILSQVTEQTVG